jgi:hypothetical protein
MKMAKQVEAPAHEKADMLNFYTGKSLKSIMPDDCDYADIGCTQKFCKSSIVNKPCHPEFSELLLPDTIFKKAKLFIEEMYSGKDPLIV